MQGGATASEGEGRGCEDFFADLVGFHEPSYTYVLKWGREDWKGLEPELQELLYWSKRSKLRTGERWATCGNQSTDTFLGENGPGEWYTYVLAAKLNDAAIRCFRTRQGRAEPQCSVYVQCELGEKDLHLHLVIGGPGLNKYNAKCLTKPLTTNWLNELFAQIRGTFEHGNRGARPGTLDMFQWLKDQYWAQIEGRGEQLCTVLKYKSRAGQSHACAIKADEYICNYLLCKNWKPVGWATSSLVTPEEEWFPLAGNKTYSCTLLNGELLPVKGRHALWDRLYKHVHGRRCEPMFRGDLFGNLPEVGEARWTKTGGAERAMTKRESLMIDCMKKCEALNLLTYEDLVNECPEIVIMIESMPGGGKLLEQMLHMVHIKIVQNYTPLSFINRLYPKTNIEKTNKVFQLLSLQGYNSWQAGHWVCAVLNKQAGKQNTLCFYGPASTGKTNIAKAIVNCVRLYGCVNHQNKSFIFNDCSHKLINWWEECLMHADWVEQAKCLLGGTEFRIDRKHHDSMLMPQTPIIISTNNDIYTVSGGNTVSQVHSRPLRERVVQLNMMKQLKSTFGEIQPEEVAAWLTKCQQRYNCSLEGFLKEWNLKKVPNDFPLANPCPGCSQDLTVHDNGGICVHCGNYCDPEVRDIGCSEPAEPEPLPEPEPEQPEQHGGHVVDLGTSPAKPDDSCTDCKYTYGMWGTPEKNTWSTANTLLSLVDTPPEAPKKKRKRCVDKDQHKAPGSHTPFPKKTRKDLAEALSRIVSVLGEEDEQHISHFTIKERAPEPEPTPEPEPEPESSETQNNPSIWGQMLGIYRENENTEPTVFYCFESIPESDEEGETSGKQDI